MRPRATHFLLLLDYGIGMVFAMAVFVIGALTLTMTGPLKPYEARALGGLYTEVLARIENSAHTLRADYCQRADPVAAAEAACMPAAEEPPPNLAA